jgi:hypothetical protein
MTTTLGYDFSPTTPEGAIDIGHPQFWARPISPSTAGTPLDASPTKALAACRAIWDSGARHLALVADVGSRVTGTRAMGIADAMTCCHAIRNVYNWVGPLELPSSSIVLVYLHPPPGHDLGLAYWQGWAGYVSAFALGGRHPLYPALRCDPEGIEVTCRTVHDPSAPECWGIWATSPPLANPADAMVVGGWHPARCETPFPATLLWQVARGVHVTAPDRHVLDTMFVLLDRA